MYQDDRPASRRDVGTGSRPADSGGPRTCSGRLFRQTDRDRALVALLPAKTSVLALAVDQVVCQQLAVVLVPAVIARDVEGRIADRPLAPVIVLLFRVIDHDRQEDD